MPRPVLGATDFSTIAEGALAQAHEQARLTGAALHVLHVATAGEQDVTGRLARTIDALGKAVPVEVAARVGDPAAEIVRYAREHDVGLIVLGSHGRTGPSRLLLGSVAERVARLAPCPVVIVPARAQPAVPAAPPAPPPPDPHRCVVCAGPAPDLICAPCRAHIRGEAIQRKQQEERAGRSG